jgi:hypothetical protein
MWRAAILSVLLASIAGCGGDSQQALEQTRQSLSGWSSTLQLAGEDRGRGALPDLYVRQLGKAADKQLNKQQKELSKAVADDPKRRELEQRLHEVRQQNRVFKDATARGGGGA